MNLISRRGLGSAHSLKFVKLSFSSMKRTPSVLIAVADGSEDIETITVTDVLRRADIKVTVATINSVEKPVVLSRGTKIMTDSSIVQCAAHSWDMIVLPGGMHGAENLHSCSELKHLLLEQNKSGKFVAAICASPAVVLAPLGIIDNKRATCYPIPKFTNQLKHYTDQDVIQEGNVITANGPSSSIQFALKLVEVLVDKRRAEEVGKALLFKSK